MPAISWYNNDTIVRQIKIAMEEWVRDRQQDKHGTRLHIVSFVRNSTELGRKKKCSWENTWNKDSRVIPIQIFKASFSDERFFVVEKSGALARRKSLDAILTMRAVFLEIRKKYYFADICAK